MVMIKTYREQPACNRQQDRISEELLWLSFKNGDREAFSMLYRRYWQLLCNTATAICADDGLAMDCVQDLFMELWKNREGISVPISVKAYLLRSTQRKIFKYVKKARINPGQYMAEAIADKEAVPCMEKKMILEQFAREQKDDLLKAVMTLTRRQREAVFLRFYADLSYTEIAGKMAISTDSIYNLISKAMRNMHGELKRLPMQTL